MVLCYYTATIHTNVARWTALLIRNTCRLTTHHKQNAKCTKHKRTKQKRSTEACEAECFVLRFRIGVGITVVKRCGWLAWVRLVDLFWEFRIVAVASATGWASERVSLSTSMSGFAFLGESDLHVMGGLERGEARR